MKWITNKMIAVALFIALMTGISMLSAGVTNAAPDAAASLATIESIKVVGDGDAAELIIKLSSKVTYTSYKTIAPLRLVIDFSQATQGTIVAPLVFNKGNFKTVTVSRYNTDAGVLTRVDVELLRDVNANIVASKDQLGELRVSFPPDKIAAQEPPVETPKAAVLPVVQEAVIAKPEPVTPPPPAPVKQDDPAPVASSRLLTAINAKSDSIILQVDGGVESFNSFRLNKPERFVIDLPGVQSGLSAKLLPINTAGVSSARIGVYPEKLRVVFDAVSANFPEVSAAKSTEGVSITILSTKNENANTRLVATNSEKAQSQASPPIEAAPASEAPVAEKAVSKKTATRSKVPLTIEKIDFQVLDGISRVSIKLSGDAAVNQPVKSDGFVTLSIKNASLPKHLQRSLETQEFVSPVLRVTPSVIKTSKGKGTDVKIRIALRKIQTSFEFKQESDVVLIDFKNPDGLTAEKLGIDTTSPRVKSSSGAKASSASREQDISNELSPASADQLTKSGSKYSNKKVSLEFADAEVRKIFQLLAEVSNKNFVLGDDVTGQISLKLVNVPWDQALEIILDTKDLDKRETGNIIFIRKKGKFKSQHEEDLKKEKEIKDRENEIKKIAAQNIELEIRNFSVNYASISEIASQFKSLQTPERGQITTDTRTNKVIVKDIPKVLDDMDKLLKLLDLPERQVMIEARIVEATTTFTRNLGVNWGLHKTMGTNLPFPAANAINSGFGGLTSYAPPTSSGSVGSVPGGQLGMMFGTLTAGIELDMKINAAATAQLIKIISSPKVATLNHKTAKISQGVQIPYQNTTATTGAVTAFVAATLSLEVTPHINANNTIVMKIDAKNDAPGTGSPPAINTKQATTEMLLKDGETTVIGGIFVESETEGDTGVPYLMEIPLLGNLFKSTEKLRTKSELLIFITPRILVVN